MSTGQMQNVHQPQRVEKKPISSHQLQTQGVRTAIGNRSLQQRQKQDARGVRTNAPHNDGKTAIREKGY